MSYWDYKNVGASPEHENEGHIRKIFEYIGFNPRAEYNGAYEERSFDDDPDVYCCKYSNYEPFSGKSKKAFENMQDEELLDLLNALFPKTNVYVHHSVGNDTNDTWENHSVVYDTSDMTCYYDSSYTSYDCGPNGKRSYKERFALKPPKTEYVKALVDLSTADGNGELTALLLELSRKLKEGLIVYPEDSTDTRVVGKQYDTIDDVTGEEDWNGDDEDEKPEESALTGFRTVTYGRYPTTEAGTDETPIEWLVMEVDKTKHRALLLSRYGLAVKPYHDDHKPVTWETCTLRAWLNNDFLSTAFTEKEQSFILQTETDNSKSQGNRKWCTDGGNDTRDMVFLLSFAEAMKYFEGELSRRCAVTPFAREQGAESDDLYVVDGMDAGWWWLRSPGGNYFNAAAVNPDGSLRYFIVNYDFLVIRPAFWINLDSECFNP